MTDDTPKLIPPHNAELLTKEEIDMVLESERLGASPPVRLGDLPMPFERRPCIQVWTSGDVEGLHRDEVVCDEKVDLAANLFEPRRGPRRLLDHRGEELPSASRGESNEP